MLGLVSLASQFTLLLCLSLARHTALDLGRLSLSWVHRPSSGLDPWVTRIFIVIALQSAAIYLISICPGMADPLWLGIVLLGLTYGSAAVYYASGDEGPYDE